MGSGLPVFDPGQRGGPGTPDRGGPEGPLIPIVAAMSDGETGPEEGGFDGRLERLEGIVSRLEEGGLELEPAIERYREGVALLKECRDVLGRYREQVE